MKIIFFVFSFLLHSALVAQELQVEVLEGWNSTLVKNCTLKLHTRKGKLVQETKTDSLGKGTFRAVPKGRYYVVAESENSNYKDGYAPVDIDNDVSLTTIIYPTLEFESKQGDYEDSIYYSMEKSYSTDTDVPDSLTIEAVFPGGMDEMVKFLEENVIYPEISRELGDQGRVYVSFIVEPDGVLTHIEVMRGATEELNSEATRIVRAMPLWSPGIIGGKKIRAKCALPITFTLN